jgi:hypothetical protein
MDIEWKTCIKNNPKEVRIKVIDIDASRSQKKVLMTIPMSFAALIEMTFNIHTHLILKLLKFFFPGK